MTEHISVYIKDINQLYQTGLTTEHSFRPALQRLLQNCTGCTVINEQSHIDCGAPDLTLLSKQLPIAYIEANIFGNEGHFGYDAFTAEVTMTFHEVLGVAPENVYINYSDIPDWGASGRNFDRNRFR